MLRHSWFKAVFWAFALAAAISTGPALADKPSWAGEKGGKGSVGEQRNEGPRAQERGTGRDQTRSQSGRPGRIEHFADQNRLAVREFYGSQFQSGRCPPGLAKKQNGCMPPGQAKKWAIGRPLPRGVVLYDVPPPLLTQLPPPLVGHRYVRVAGDILMIAIGTALVVDAIEDLGR